MTLYEGRDTATPAELTFMSCTSWFMVLAITCSSLRATISGLTLGAGILPAAKRETSFLFLDNETALIEVVPISIPNIILAIYPVSKPKGLKSTISCFPKRRNNPTGSAEQDNFD